MKVFTIPIFLMVFVQLSWVSCADSDDEEWKEFKKRYGLSYNGVDDTFRMGVYLMNKNRIDNHNQCYDKKKITFKLAMNKFGAYLDDEVRLMKLNPKNELPGTPFTGKCSKLHHATEKHKETTLDWRVKGKVGSVKDQGNCSSAWAFSALGVIEGSLAIYSGSFLNLSAQSLIDCSKSSGKSAGCQGGYPYSALNYLKENHAIDREESYNYTASDGDACRTDNSNHAVHICGSIDCIEPGNETQLEELVSRGPTSVMIDASNWKFRFYHSGMYADLKCSSSVESLNHPMLIVGYNNTDPAKSYWLAQNSWGESWGENGVMQLPKHAYPCWLRNHCGIATSAFGFTTIKCS